MEQYISKSALVAEIERKINEINLDSIEDWRYRLQREHDIEVMKNVFSIIDTLEVKEVDLEKSIDDYIYTHDGRKRLALELDWKQCNITFNNGKLIDFAKHFFELGIKAQKGEKV